MTAERCDLTELLVDQCAHCLGHTNPIVEAAQPRHYAVDVENPPTTTAVFPSRCPDCNEPIRVGDQITLTGGTGGSSGSWVCEGCAP